MRHVGKASPTRLWQKSYYDHALRLEEDIRAVAEYIIGNPARAGLTHEVGQYPYAGSFVWSDLSSMCGDKTFTEVGSLEC